jgi:conjugative transfer protein TraD
MTVHTREQGIRLHYLANLGGLVAVAGLDRHPPDFLLGLLLAVAVRVPQLTPTQRTAFCSRGQARLEERGTQKRAWSAWQRAQELHRVDLSTAEIGRLLAALGDGHAALTDTDPAEALLRALRGPR